MFPNKSLRTGHTQTFSNHSTQPATQIFKWKVHELEVKPHIWGRELRWGKLVTMEPEKRSPACNWYMRWRKRHYRRGKKPPDSSLVWCIDSSVYDRDVTEMKASINISSITCWAFGGFHVISDPLQNEDKNGHHMQRNSMGC